jgi:predicted chitinase
MAEFFINTPLRQAGFIAQLGHESTALPSSAKTCTTVMLRVWR